MQPRRMELNVADAMRLGGAMCRAERFAEAERVFRGVTEADPGNHHAMHAIALCAIEQNRCEEAISWLDRAASHLRDELISLACNRGKALAELSRAEDALAVLDSVVNSSHGYTPAYYNRGLVLLQMGRHQEAIADLDKVLAVHPDHDKARFGRGFANLVLGNYAEGFRDYECRLKDEITEPDAVEWTGEQSLEGKTIIVHGEQGLGDNIMFARYLPMMVSRGARVLVWVPRSVQPLLRHLPGVELLGEDRETWPKSDYWIRFMSLALAFGTIVETVPPPFRLKLDDVGAWRAEINGPGLKVGLCWSGSPQSRYDSHRSVPLRELAPLFDVPGVSFYSLQLGVRDSDKATFDGSPIIDLSANLTDFGETAAAMSCLDLVITCDTSVAHLAGTVGLPTFVMLTSFRTYWLWIQNLQTSPWYPSVRLFRQERDGEWGPVCIQLKRALDAMAV